MVGATFVSNEDYVVILDGVNFNGGGLFGKSSLKLKCFRSVSSLELASARTIAAKTPSRTFSARAL